MQHGTDILIRPSTMSDIDALLALERNVFATDCMSRKSLRRFLSVPTAVVLIAQPQDSQNAIAGCAVLLLRASTPEMARLYSLAVDPAHEGFGIGPMLLQACEESARTQGRTQIRLEVHETNERAIALYRKEGYAEFGRHVGYYKDLGDALRFRKTLSAPELKPAN